MIKECKVPAYYLFIICLLMAVLPQGLSAERNYAHPDTYIPTFRDLDKAKSLYDDPRPYLNEMGPKKLLPKDLYDTLCYDVDKMKDLWAELVGFRSPDIVGKIHPEITPGKYTWKEVQNNPAFKELLLPGLFDRIKPGQPPFAMNIPEFEIVPTQQYYWSLPISEMTQQNLGKTKLDENGYLVVGTWEGGYPFPKPSGPYKAIQIMYNFEKRYLSWNNCMVHYTRCLGADKNLNIDSESTVFVRRMALSGRAIFEPFGYYDETAKNGLELNTFVVGFLAPRDIMGGAQYMKIYQDPDKSDQTLMYIPSLRRIRKMSATDTQDPVMGQDLIYDDMDGFTQKISSTRKPYQYELLDEREFLLPATTEDGAPFLSKEGLEYRNVTMERRPCYVLKLTQLDPTYVYSYRIIYIDKETFQFYRVENYDRKKRLYRTMDGCHWGWFPEMGQLAMSGGVFLAADHQDLHSTMVYEYELPAYWTRKEVNLQGFKMKK